MTLKKLIISLTALATASSSLGTTALSAIAANDGNGYTEGKMPTFLYALDNQTEINCRFYDNMPNIAYISLADYYKNWAEDAELTIEKNEDGTYTITTQAEDVAVMDTDKDTLSFQSLGGFLSTPSELSGDEDMANLFLRSKDITMDDEDGHEIVLDFSNYDIDIIGEEDAIWFPVTTLCDVFNSTIHCGFYINHVLYFCDNTSAELNCNMLINMDNINAYFAENMNGRPADMIAYNYNELCFVLDSRYGFPGRIPLNDALQEKGLDKLLSETNDDTRLVKEHLLSEDIYAYFTGLIELDFYLWDGGHTSYSAIPLALFGDLSAFANYLKADMNYEGCSDFLTNMDNYYASLDAISAARQQFLATAENVTPFEDALYLEVGDTAMFITDSMMITMDEWVDYYKNEDAEMPQDVVSEYYSCLKRADENPAIKNFVVDISANGGGLVMLEAYMMSLISDDDSMSVYSVLAEAAATESYYVDKNLDKELDELDEALDFDLNIGVLCSNCSFSAANLMASDAREAGLLLLGEQSGGGSCAVDFHMTADGFLYTISSVTKLLNSKIENIDLGIAPDAPLVVINEDGSKDYSAFYDFDAISKAFAEFYPEEAEDPSVTTEPAVTTEPVDTTAPVEEEGTTTTTTVVTDPTVSGETTAPTTSEGDPATTTTTTDAEPAQPSEGGELPQTGFSRYYSVVEALACMMIFAGAAILTATRKKENE